MTKMRCGVFSLELFVFIFLFCLKHFHLSERKDLSPALGFYGALGFYLR